MRFYYLLLFISVSIYTGFASAPSYANSIPTPKSDWQELIRNSPYWISKGAFNNLATIRKWVLTGSAYCETPERHILYDVRAQFLGYFSNQPDSTSTQALLNVYRAQLVQNGKVEQWVAGSESSIGYPFALSCDQPQASLSTAYQRLTGQIESAQLWGTWDGMRIGSPEELVSLNQALDEVYENRKQMGRISMPKDILSTLTGKILIESGARPDAHSAADAKGIMQLSPQALSDCQLAARFHFHRMAQIDCGFKLLEQNHRLLQEPFTKIFGHLPESKKDSLYAFLLIQAYHGGIGRISALLEDPELNKPALYFAEHHAQYSANDIALGMIFHNLGRNQLGFASLYYVVDVGIAKEYACTRLNELSGCD